MYQRFNNKDNYNIIKNILLEEIIKRLYLTVNFFLFFSKLIILKHLFNHLRMNHSQRVLLGNYSYDPSQVLGKGTTGVVCQGILI